MRRVGLMIGMVAAALWPTSADQTGNFEQPLTAAQAPTSAANLAVKPAKLPEPAVRDDLLPAVVYQKLMGNGLPLPKLPVRASTSKNVVTIKSAVAAVNPASSSAQAIVPPVIVATPAPAVIAPAQSRVVPAASNPVVAVAPLATKAPIPTAAPVKVAPASEPVRLNAAAPVTSTKSASLSTIDQPNQLTTPIAAQGFHTEQIASLGQTVSIVFPGRGWLYLGTGTVNDGIVYLQSIPDANGERFSFRAERSGNKLLQFQKQDLTHSTLERREVLLKVGGTASDLASSPSAVTVKSMPTPTRAPIALRPSVSVYDPSVSLAPTAFQPENLSVPAVTVVPTSAPEIFKLARDKEAAKLLPEAMTLYDKLLKDFSDFEKNDQVLFNYARLLENWQDNRKLKEAYDLYARIQKEYPYSALVEEAKQRTRWLDRNFFRIR